MKIGNIWRHFRTITHHRNMVMKLCFQVGLYRQGLLHDLSKYGYVEFHTGCKYYQGTRSPNNAEREATGCSRAWLHHKGRNKHHYEYWIDYSMEPGESMTGLRMPPAYVVEMFLDRIAACKTYMKEKYTDRSPLEYYEKGADKMLIHPQTRRLLVKLLHMLARDGEEAVFTYIRREVLHKKR